jgi:flagellar basal body-associated protein FliL
MADEKTIEKPAAEATEKPAAAEKPESKAKKGSLLPWIIVAVVLLVSAGGGIGLGLIFGRKSSPEAAPAAAAGQTPTAQQTLKFDVPAGAAENVWYFDLDPVVANLNEPGATRYVRAALTLEMSGEIAVDKGTTFLEQKKPLITNLLTIYLSGLDVESTRGDKNLKRIQFEICETFNEKLFPDGKAFIKGILIMEFAVQ